MEAMASTRVQQTTHTHPGKGTCPDESRYSLRYKGGREQIARHTKDDWQHPSDKYADRPARPIGRARFHAGLSGRLLTHDGSTPCRSPAWAGKAPFRTNRTRSSRRVSVAAARRIACIRRRRCTRRSASLPLPSARTADTSECIPRAGSERSSTICHGARDFGVAATARSCLSTSVRNTGALRNGKSSRPIRSLSWCITNAAFGGSAPDHSAAGP